MTAQVRDVGVSSTTASVERPVACAGTPSALGSRSPSCSAWPCWSSPVRSSSPGAISQQLIDQGGRFYAADGVALEQAYREGDNPADSLDDVLDLEDSIVNRPDVVSATLFDAKMRKVDGPRDSNRVGVPDPNPNLSAALKEGRSFAGLEAEANEHASH